MRRFGWTIVVGLMVKVSAYAGDGVAVPAPALMPAPAVMMAPGMMPAPGPMMLAPSLPGPACGCAPVALTMEEACCALKCLPPGRHELLIIHPYTCCPVKVCVCLPCGSYELKCGKGLCSKKLEFQYPGLCNDIVVKFTKEGDVKVKG